jgi:Bacteriophage HK97-gp10, putative tail-component
MPAHYEDDRLNRLAKIVNKAIENATKLTALDLWGNIRENSPTDHGRLAGSWAMTRMGKLRYKVHTAVVYARFQNDGTGIYGPAGRPITPRKSRVLVFDVSGRTVFARSVRGVKGRRYIEKSINQTEKRKHEFVHLALSEAGLT